MKTVGLKFVARVHSLLTEIVISVLREVVVTWMVLVTVLKKPSFPSFPTVDRPSSRLRDESTALFACSVSASFKAIANRFLRRPVQASLTAGASSVVQVG